MMINIKDKRHLSGSKNDKNIFFHEHVNLYSMSKSGNNHINIKKH